MMSLFGRTSYKIAREATKTAVLDTARVTGGAAIVYSGSYLCDKLSGLNENGFLKPSDSKPNVIEDKPDVQANKKI